MVRSKVEERTEGPYLSLTPEQEAILQSTGDIRINAVAGSGKTTTIIEYARTRPAGSRIMYLAFNRSVKMEAEFAIGTLVAEDLGASEVWGSDGTGLGTQALTSFATLSSQVGQLRVVGSELFFSASTPAHGTELWVTDGTAAGTRRRNG